MTRDTTPSHSNVRKCVKFQPQFSWATYHLPTSIFAGQLKYTFSFCFLYQFFLFSLVLPLFIPLPPLQRRVYFRPYRTLQGEFFLLFWTDYNKRKFAHLELVKKLKKLDLIDPYQKNLRKQLFCLDMLKTCDQWSGNKSLQAQALWFNRPDTHSAIITAKKYRKQAAEIKAFDIIFPFFFSFSKSFLGI